MFHVQMIVLVRRCIMEKYSTGPSQLAKNQFASEGIQAKQSFQFSHNKTQWPHDLGQ